MRVNIYDSARKYRKMLQSTWSIFVRGSLINSDLGSQMDTFTTSKFLIGVARTYQCSLETDRRRTRTWEIDQPLLGIAMPGWRSLGVLSLRAGALAMLAVLDATHANGPGGALGLAIVAMVLSGLAAGVLARALALVAGGWKRPTAHLAIVLAGLLVLHGLLAGWPSW